MKKRALGILLSTGPANVNLSTAVNLSDAALRAGVDVYLYLIDEGVLAVGDPRFQLLRDSGLKLFACAYGAQQHGVARADDKATYCRIDLSYRICTPKSRLVKAIPAIGNKSNPNLVLFLDSELLAIFRP